MRFFGHRNACAASRSVSVPSFSEVCPGGVTLMMFLFDMRQVNKNGGKRDKKVSDDVRDRIRATSSTGGVRIVSLRCGEVLGTHDSTRFNHNGPLYDFKKIPVNTA